MDLRGLLADRLPGSWTVRRPANRAPSLEVRAPDGSSAVLRLLERRFLEPRDVAALRNRSGLAGLLVVAPFLSARTRELLEAEGASYVDETGNVRIALESPSLFIRLDGALKSPRREARLLSSLKGPAAARVVRGLLDFRPPYGVRELAAKAGCSPASVSRAVRLLEGDAIVVRAGERVVEVDWPALLKRWTGDYGLFPSNRVATFLEPRGLDALMGKLRDLKVSTAVTGSLAAVRRVAFAAPRLATVYVDDPEALGARLKLHPAETGANVMLVRPLSAVALERTWTQEGVSYAALSQVAADLLTSPGRAPAEAGELIEWMKRHEGEWRA